MKNIKIWEPENQTFWNHTGKRVAYRNLIVSSFSLLFAFMVWMQWSAVIVFLAKSRPEFSNSNIYWLTALPLLSGGILRIPYSFITPLIGGGRWNAISQTLLLLPLFMTFFCFEFKLGLNWHFAAAFLTGIAGANFSSSCNNICYFFPYRLRSIALGN